jgi:hypothetical protein
MRLGRELVDERLAVEADPPPECLEVHQHGKGAPRQRSG